MTNYANGHEAEKYAAEYLKNNGYKILAINWRRPRAEIDIIAQQKHQPILFVEVKYRQHTKQGSGLDYITDRKLQQMAFAAELWVAENRYDGQIELGAMELTGETYAVTNFVSAIS